MTKILTYHSTYFIIIYTERMFCWLNRKTRGGVKVEKIKYPEVWNLDVFFPGESESPQLQEHLNYIEKEVSDFQRKVDTFRTH